MRQLQRWAPHLAVLAGVLVANASPAAGQNTAGDPDPKQLLLEAARFHQSQPMVSFALEVSQKISMGEQEQESSTSFAVERALPNKFSIKSEDGMFTIKSDGQDLLIHANDRFAVEPAPESLAAFAENQVARVVAGGMGGLVFSAINPEATQELLKTAEVTYEGKESIDGVEAHKVLVDTDETDWTVYIDAGKQPTVLRVSPDMSEVVKQAAAARGQDLSLQVNLSLKDYQGGEEGDESAFALSIPENAELVDSLFESSDGPHPLVGQAAPGFALKGANGEETKLSKLLADNKVVILDFWATWCGPCVMALPKVTKVTSDFADQGVALYGVNVREDSETVSEFLSDKDYKLNVLFDSEGAVTEEFGVNGIPHTAIVGQDGRVQVVHIGYSEDLEERLTEELQQLVDGVDLAAEAVAEREQKEAERGKRLEEMRQRFAERQG